MKIKGKFKSVLRDKDGNTKDVRDWKDNVVTEGGKAGVALLILGAGTAFDSVAIGSGTTGVTAGSTQLSEETNTRTSATTTTQTTDSTGDTSRFVATFTFTQTDAIKEVGIFNHASTGDCLCGQTFADVNVIDGDSLQITYDVDLD